MKRGKTAITGVMMKSSRSAPRGTIACLRISLMRSAMNWKRPFGPTRLGPAAILDHGHLAAPDEAHQAGVGEGEVGDHEHRDKGQDAVQGEAVEAEPGQGLTQPVADRGDVVQPDQRSTSPMLMSIEPKIAITSAIFQPRTIDGSAVRLMKDGERSFPR